tara:strand:+ start:143 stop:532 length:390 start_codon:yes stop_codon:yes gene_type:complete
MQYAVVREGEVVETGDVLNNVKLMPFLNSMVDRVEVGDIFKTERWVVMYTGYGTWRSVTADESKFWDMGLNLRTVATLRRRCVTFKMIKDSTKRDFIKSYGKVLAKDIENGLALIGESFKDGPPTTIDP